MELKITQAGIVRLPPGINTTQLGQIEALLTYNDSGARYEYLRFKKNGAFYVKDEAEFDAKLAALKANIKKSILFQDKDGYWTYSGLAKPIAEILKTSVTSEISYPAAVGLKWTPDNSPWPFQTEATEALVAAKHGGVSIGTGLGKSTVIGQLIHHYGLKTVVMTPSSSISEQLYKDFCQWFGPSKVGRFFDQKKELDKLIVVANGQSLTRVQPGSPAANALKSTAVFIADESHQTPAATFEKVCIGLLADVPYRYFFSATQMRGDGKGIVLDGITGPIVYEKSVRQGIDEKYLAEPRVRMIPMPANGERHWSDQQKMTRHHLFYNPLVTQKIGTLCNQAATAGMPVLVLIEEVEQFTNLLPYLQFEVGFAYGGASDANYKKIPPQYHESDKAALVGAFNAGKLPILVGTSAISTGTNITAVKFLIYWQGSQSEVQVKQAIGRSTRKALGKTFCHVVDFDVQDQNFLDANGDVLPSTCHRHAQARLRYYRSVTGRVVQSG